jgi:hypothetical protein
VRARERREECKGIVLYICIAQAFLDHIGIGMGGIYLLKVDILHSPCWYFTSRR